MVPRQALVKCLPNKTETIMRRSSLAKRLAVSAIPLFLLGVATAQAQSHGPNLTREGAARVREELNSPTFTREDGARVRAEMLKAGWPLSQRNPRYGTCNETLLLDAAQARDSCRDYGNSDAVCKASWQSRLYKCGALDP